MTDDLLSYAQVVTPRDRTLPELLAMAERVAPPDPRGKKVRRRPNKGRVKRTNHNPPLAEPPWGVLRELNIPLPPLLQNLPTPPTNWRVGPRANLWRVQVREMWGTVCHLCGHDQAYTADHLIPVSQWPNQPYEPMLARPAHGVKQPDGSEGCPTCGLKCNSSRGNRAMAIHIGQYKPVIEL